MKSGDIVLVSGRGWRARLIKWFTRSRGEAKTKVTHCALAVSSTHVIHATWRGVRVGKRDRGAAYRPTNIPAAALGRIVSRAYSYTGRPYGYGTILLHVLGLQKFASGEAPICSWIVTVPYSEEGYHFGVEPRAASPDDIADYIDAHPKRYAIVP
jgi:hypothetical protein